MSADARRLDASLCDARCAPQRPRIGAGDIHGEPDITTMPADDTPPFDYGATPKAQAPRIELVRFTVMDLLADIEPEKWLLPGVPAEAYTLIAGGLSSYKTTLLLYLGAWRATGYDILGLDMHGSGIDIGKFVLATYEDTVARMKAKWQRVIQHGHQHIVEKWGKRDADSFAERAAANFLLVPCSGKLDNGIVRRIDGGLIVRNDAFLAPLVDAVRVFAPEGALIGLDPLRLAIAGSQNDDDGADIAVHTLNALATAIPGCGVIVCSHSTKAGAQEPGTGYTGAAYATSGSALYSQHARSNYLMARLPAEVISKTFVRTDVSAGEAEQQRVVRLTHGRLSHGVEHGDVYLLMRKGTLHRIEPARKDKSPAQIITSDGPIIVEAVQRISQSGVKVSAAALEADGALVDAIGGRARMRTALELLIQNGHIHTEGQARATRYTVTDLGRTLLSDFRRDSQKGVCDDSG